MTWVRLSVLIFISKIPAIIVAIFAPTGWKHYTATSGNCWLSTEDDGSIWVYLALITFIVAVIFIAFLFISLAIYNFGSKICQSLTHDEMMKFSQIKKDFQFTASFFCLLWITWIFGGYVLGQAGISFIYLFAICNALQGIYIFLFHCYFDQK